MEKDKQQTGSAQPARRLCSEIQLFDLCDRERCAFKDGRFCTDKELLARFEQLPEEDEASLEPSGEDRLGRDLEDDESLYPDEDDFEDLDDGFDPEEDEWRD